MKKHGYNLLIAVLTIILSTGCKTEKKPSDQMVNKERTTKPNILFLLTDDQSFNTIHALGNEEVYTPNMDKLVAQGMAFTHAYIMGGNTGAICMPSRAMIMTGKYVQRLSKERGAIATSDITLPQALKKLGYTTFGTGKWHNAKPSFAKSFTTGGNIFMGGMSDHLKVPLHNFDVTGKYPKDSIFYKNEFSSKLFREATVDFLENYKDDNPFFAYVAFSSPHDPRMAPEEYQKKYNTKEISLPKNFFPKHPFDNGELIIRDENLLPFPRTEEAVRGEIASYYAMVSEVDNNIGKVLDALEKSGKADNTIIILAGDNGLAAGQHGLLGKQNLYDHSVRVPLIIVGPGIQPGTKAEGLVYLNDIFPTVAELVGAETPSNIGGKSFASMLENPTFEIRESVFFLYKNFQRGIRTKNWKLIKYLVNGKQTTQLFHISNDPLEMNNLADDLKYKDKVAEMTVKLQDWINKSGDNVQLDQPDWGVPVLKSWATDRKERGLSLDFNGNH